MRRLRKKFDTALRLPRNRYPRVEPNTKSLINWPADDMRQRTMRMLKRNIIWMLTILSSAVRLIGAAVAFRMSFVS